MYQIQTQCKKKLIFIFLFKSSSYDVTRILNILLLKRISFEINLNQLGMSEKKIW